MYFLFAYDWYYPSGGFGDYQGSAATVDEARARFRALHKTYDDVDIVVLRDGELVEVSAEIMNESEAGS